MVDLPLRYRAWGLRGRLLELVRMPDARRRDRGVHRARADGPEGDRPACTNNWREPQGVRKVGETGPDGSATRCAPLPGAGGQAPKRPDHRTGHPRGRTPQPREASRA
jgi:hypothetical protein